MTQPIGPIDVQAPVPSILTTARDRTSDNFGLAPLPVNGTQPEGGLGGSTVAWRTGVTWSPTTCQPSGNWEQCVAPEDRASSEKDEDDGTMTPVTFSPFWSYTPLSCEWTTMPEDVDKAAEALTEAHAAYSVARALWLGEGYGAADTTPTLRNSAVDVTPGGAAVDLDDAVATVLGAYEQGTGGNGAATVHIPGIMFVGALGGLPGGGRVCWPEGQQYRGALGSLVSPGPGYPWGASTAGADGYGPQTDVGPPALYAGNAEDEVWVYVTGPVEYALSPIIRLSPTPGLQQRRNVHEVIAERQAVVRFDPCSVWACRAYNTVVLGGSS